MQGKNVGEEGFKGDFIIGKRKNWDESKAKFTQKEEENIASSEFIINKKKMKIISMYEE